MGLKESESISGLLEISKPDMDSPPKSNLQQGETHMAPFSHKLVLFQAIVK